MTDTHIREKNKLDIDRRIKALIDYLETTKESIDVIAFTGDLAFSGQISEYDLFDKYVAKPLKRKLRVSDSRFLMIPGNHDIYRPSVSKPDHDKLRKLTNPRDAEGVISKMDGPWARQKNYQDYVLKSAPKNKPVYHYNEYANGLYSSRKFINIKGVSLGVALFNSSWLSVDDADASKLFITEKQVDDLQSGLQGCDIQIALMHHPFDWFHPSEENLAINDIRRDFSIVLTGHLHKPVTCAQSDTSSDSVTYTARAFFEGKTGAEVDDGVQIYDLDLQEKKITTHYKKYIRRRNTFDKDTDHAQGGEVTLPLPLSVNFNSSSSLIVQKLVSDSGKLTKEIKTTLSRLQGIPNPVFVTPKIESYSFKSGRRLTLDPDFNISNLKGKKVIMTGASDSGKSILLKTMASEHPERSCSDGRRNATIFVEGSNLPNEISSESLIDMLAIQASCEVQELNNLCLRILIDRFPHKEADSVNILNQVCLKNNWSYVVSCGSFSADVLVQQAEFRDTIFIELQPWGPSRIKEFSIRMFEGSDTDPLLAYRFISQCLSIVDLPTTPTIISLYLSIFSKIGSDISSISFLRLLEKIESIRIGANESGSVYSLYNRQKILALLAVECINESSISISQEKFSQMITRFFDIKGLDVEAEVFSDFLVDSGLLVKDRGNVGFSNYVFFDFYLARAFQSGLLNKDQYINDVRSCSRVASSLSLFAGLDRENIGLISGFMDTIEGKFTASGSKNLENLDKHISSLLISENRISSDVEAVAEEAMCAKEDMNAEDRDYIHQRKQVKENRERLMDQKLDDSVDDLSLQIEGLTSFYLIFKNLENIDFEWKYIYLDRILDYHITTNFDLINFYFEHSKDENFRTCAAYMLTWTGHSFMLSTLGNPNLCRCIKKVLDTTDNDFKKLLLLLMLSELGDESAPDRIDAFISKTSSRAATEMIFIHLRRRLVKTEKKSIPIKLVSVFKNVFLVRQTKFNGSENTGNAKDKFESVMRQIRVEHSSFLKDMAKMNDDSINSDQTDVIEV